MDRGMAVAEGAPIESSALAYSKAGSPDRAVPCRFASLEEIASTCETALLALYLPGAPRGHDPPPALWPAVLALLRQESASLGSVSRVLARAGFREESAALADGRLLDWAQNRRSAGLAVSAASSRYPRLWRLRLGAQAPPAVWVQGPIPEAPALALVGSRSIGPGDRWLAFRCGAEAARLGSAVVSGGASGCDRAAVLGAVSERAEVVEILPCGLNRRSDRFPGTVLSPFAPDAEFTAAQAMRRNLLIYAWGEAAVVLHARFGEGGAWKGAVEARRRRLCPMAVRAGLGRASSALAALGAATFECPEDLGPALAAAARQESSSRLFA